MSGEQPRAEQRDTRLYSIGEVAAMLGVSPHTIRAWERRHGVLSPVRTPARQRRYRTEDVELLRDVKRAIDLRGYSLKLAFQAVSGDIAPEQSSVTTRERVREIAALPEDAALWQAIGDVIPELILIVDHEGTIVEVNVAVARAFGMVRQRLTGRKFVDLVDPFDRAKAALLYRPGMRAARGWELNVTMEGGVRLYSFQSQVVRQGERRLLALVGSEMYPSDSAAQTEEARGVELASRLNALSIGSPELGSMRALERLVQHLPFGVAVVTVGPEPRFVYGNSRFLLSFGITPRSLVGRPLRDLLGDERVEKALHEAVKTRRSRTLGGLLRTPRPGAKGAPRLLNLAFRPLFSAEHRVTSVLVVVEDAGSDVTLHHELEKLVTDERLQRARNAQQLAETGLDHLRALVPEVEFVVGLLQATGRSSGEPRLHVAGRRSLVSGDLAESPAGRLLREVLASGRPAELRTGAGHSARTFTALPVKPSASLHSKRSLGVVAWWLPAARPLSDQARSAVDAFIGHLALAAELLNVRSDLGRKAARLDAVSAATSAVRDRWAGEAPLGVRFLERLCRSLHADAAAIGHAEDGDFVLDAGYPPSEVVAAGDRFPLETDFVAKALATGEPVASSRMAPGVKLPDDVRREVARMRHGLAVPLLLGGQVSGVVVAMRRSAPAFGQEDIVIVQSLSSVALLSVTMARAASRVYKSGRATRATRSASSVKR